MAQTLYYLGLAFLFTHELDAVTHSEWRLLFGLRDLPEDTAAPWFVALHVPFFFAILWLSHATREGVRRAVRGLVASFFVVHALMHFALSSHDEYGFHGLLSNGLIVGAAVCGMGYVVMSWRLRGPTPGASTGAAAGETDPP